MLGHQVVVGLLVGLVLAFDMQNVLSRWQRRLLQPASERSDDYTIVVPLYGHPRYFQNRAHLAPNKARVVVAIDVSSEALTHFAAMLEADGWRVFRTRQVSPSPPTLIKAVLEADAISTAYVVRLDADTYFEDDLNAGIAAMAADGADVCSVKVHVREPRSMCQHFQALEYRMAMLSRHYRPWLTSGACTIAKTKSLRDILARHSLWTPGEDIETGRVAHALKLRIRHLDLRATSEAPERWGELFKQRSLWWAGNFRHSVVNADRNALHLPLWTIYYFALVWVGLIFRFKALAVTSDPGLMLRSLPILILIYATMTLIANFQVRHPLMVVFPIYALIQSMLMATWGAIMYARLVRERGRWGRYRFGYRRAAVSA